MPKIEISFKDLKKLVGKEIDIENFEDDVLFVKGEIEEIDNDTIKIDIKDTNRPDLWSVEGIARHLRGYYGIELGMPKFDVKKSCLEVIVDKKVESVRPKTVCAIVKNLTFDDESIKQMIQLQEKVCQTFGRKRDFAAIGVYDYDKIKWPIRYTTFKPTELKFAPLGFEEEMTLKEILEKHPKGKEYGHLIANHKEYPIFIDSEGNVLSMPPVINSNYTGRVDETTKNVFVEVSGHDLRYLNIALNVMVTALKERGGEIYSVDVIYGNDKITTPDLTPKTKEMKIGDCKKILGIELTKEEIINLLKKSRFDVSLNGENIRVNYVPYRDDIMDWRDIAEEVAISYGYNKIEPEEIRIWTRGKETDLEVFSNRVREICIGVGLQEIMTFILSSKDVLLEKMGIDEPVVEIENPISSTWSVLRNSLIPTSLEFLSKNKHVEFPQSIFEIGDVVKPDETMETKTKDLRNLSVTIADIDVGYERISSVLNAIMRNLGIEYTLKPTKDKRFIEGRSASIIVDEKIIGIIGEIHPEVLEKFELETPVATLEINLNDILKY